MQDVLIGGGVLGLRFFVPLLILRYPLPGLVAAVLADSIDGAVLSGYTSYSLDGYQHFDKAFDTYYLALAYVAMLRNWTDPVAITIGRLLWFYRLVGVALFAVGGGRHLLFVFPAAFEIYFVIYEVIRVRWRASRLGVAHLMSIGVAAWLLKLPQEYWLHIAEGSTTDWAKETIFGVDTSTSRFDILVANPWLVPLAAGVVAAAVWSWRLLLRHLPPPDHPNRFDANRHERPGRERREASRTADALLGSALLEKLTLVCLVGIVFAEFLDVNASTVQLIIALTFLVVVNALVTSSLAPPGEHPRSVVNDVAVMCAINTPLIFSFAVLARWSEASLGVISGVCYLVVLSLFIGLHDRYTALRG